MRLAQARVQNFKSIDDSGNVSIDPAVTVLVGQNEAGKTAFLQALYKARAADGGGKYDRDMDYPRIALNDYEETHPHRPATTAMLTYALSPDELGEINVALGADVLSASTFTLTHDYGNESSIGLVANELAFVRKLVDSAGLSADAASPLRSAASVRGLLESLESATRTPEVEAFYLTLKSRFEKMTNGWHGADYEIWHKHVLPALPSFIYFDDYRLLPGRMNLSGLHQRLAQSSTAPNVLSGSDRAVLGLLRMAKVDLEQLLAATTYESITAKLEAFSNKVTDRVFRYWKQNDQLEVRVDVRQTPGEQPPFNDGPNLEIRIYNKRHRVTVSFDQRSRGFIWFFSFLVWFDSVKKLLGTDKNLVLLLDEPGLNLHALAQDDFLQYIDDLSDSHQTIYTTHSPFMVHSDRLHQVRLVEDRKELGTKIDENISGSDPKTIFPLQAALGYTIAQNLFISKRNLLVEGPSDLIYLQQASSALEALGRPGLRSDVTIVPAGGLENVATFVALLGGNKLEIVVVHDHDGKPNQRIENLQREKLIREKCILTYALFRSDVGKPKLKKAAKNPASPHDASRTDGSEVVPTDIEDLFPISTYLELFNATFGKRLTGKVLESALPPGERIVERLTRYLAISSIELRPKGGFNHYAVANFAAAHPIANWSEDTLSQFETLFVSINQLFTAADAGGH